MTASFFYIICRSNGQKVDIFSFVNYTLFRYIFPAFFEYIVINANYKLSSIFNLARYIFPDLFPLNLVRL